MGGVAMSQAVSGDIFVGIARVGHGLDGAQNGLATHRVFGTVAQDGIGLGRENQGRMPM